MWENFNQEVRTRREPFLVTFPEEAEKIPTEVSGEVWSPLLGRLWGPVVGAPEEDLSTVESEGQSPRPFPWSAQRTT